ncbi:hypothetical protein Tco_0896338 [Tanacetum coccineum]
MRIDPTKTPEEPTYQVVLDALALTTCYPAFLITAEVQEIYMHQFWHTITKIKNSPSYKFKLEKKKCIIYVEVVRDILQICPRLPNPEFVIPPSSNLEIVSFIKELSPAEITNRKIQNSTAYKTYLAFATGAATPKKARKFKKPAFPSKKKTFVSIEEPAKKPAKKPAARRQSANVQIRDTPGVFVSKNKAPAKAERSKGIELLSKAALLKEARLKKAIKQRKRETNIHQAGGSRDTDDDDDYDQQSDYEQTVYDNPRTSDDEEETQEDEFIHTPEDYVPTDNETNDVDDEEYDRINKEMYDDVNVKLRDAKLDGEGKDDEEMTDTGHVKAEHENVNQEVAGDQVKDDAQATFTATPAIQKTKVPLQSSSISSDYATKFLNFDNIPSADTEIILMMDIKVQHEDPSIQTSPLLTVPDTTLKDVDHSLALCATIKSEVLTAIKEYLGTSLDDALYAMLQRHTTDLIKEQSVPTDVVEKLKHQYKPEKSVKDICKNLILKEPYEDAMDKGVTNKSKKRKPDDADEDEYPSARLNKGLKRKKTSKDAKPSKKAKSTKSSKGTTKSQPKSTSKSAQAEETVFEDGDTQVPHNQEDDMDPEWNECKTVDNKPTQKWLSDIAKAEKPSKIFDDLMSTLIDFSAFIVPVDYFFNNDLAYLQGGSTGRTYTTSLTKTKAAKHFNLEGDVIVHLAIALRMFTMCIVIKKRVEDLKLGVESYQKKLNILRPLTHKVGITDLEPYTTYSNPQGVIYMDKLERNKLMCSRELYKFSDGTFILVQDKLNDTLNNLEMGNTSVMPRRKWSNLDKKWSRIMVKNIDRQLLERRLMRSLEKFVGGRDYEKDLRLLQQTI